MVYYTTCGDSSIYYCEIYYNEEYKRNIYDTKYITLKIKALDIAWPRKEKDLVSRFYNYTSRIYYDGITTKYPFH